MTNTKTTDARYVASDDSRAVLRAWAGPDGTMDMGGWTDTNRDAFYAVVLDELRAQGPWRPAGDAAGRDTTTPDDEYDITIEAIEPTDEDAE